ncbi:YegP family protein [Arthrobacter globiformis]|uniref:YegP family protein n=1 Tax=Arthrobacter globiformis TaxID=1665 RepID=UPI0027D7A2B8|nr:YegP family protein [Arthrobacter globiformis]
MSGTLKSSIPLEGGYRFRLMDAAGNHLATSGVFPTKQAAAAGIFTVREVAGTGLVSDMCGDEAKTSDPESVRPMRQSSERRPLRITSPRVHAWRWSKAH